jgi:hypothetical protein
LQAPTSLRPYLVGLWGSWWSGLSTLGLGSRYY